MNVNEPYKLKLTDKNGEEFSISEEEIKAAFANCLKYIRRYKEYTLKQVADGTGIPIPTVQRYESGENTPSVVQAFKFAYFYKIDLNDMLLAGYVNEEYRESIFEERIGKLK